MASSQSAPVIPSKRDFQTFAEANEQETVGGSSGQPASPTQPPAKIHKLGGKDISTSGLISAQQRSLIDKIRGKVRQTQANSASPQTGVTQSASDTADLKVELGPPVIVDNDNVSAADLPSITSNEPMKGESGFATQAQAQVKTSTEPFPTHFASQETAITTAISDQQTRQETNTAASVVDEPLPPVTPALSYLPPDEFARELESLPNPLDTIHLPEMG